MGIEFARQLIVSPRASEDVDEAANEAFELRHTLLTGVARDVSRAPQV
jgi:hypothetical protein